MATRHIGIRIHIDIHLFIHNEILREASPARLGRTIGDLCSCKLIFLNLISWTVWTGTESPTPNAASPRTVLGPGLDRLDRPTNSQCLVVWHLDLRTNANFYTFKCTYTYTFTYTAPTPVRAHAHAPTHTFQHKGKCPYNYGYTFACMHTGTFTCPGPTHTRTHTHARTHTHTHTASHTHTHSQSRTHARTGTGAAASVYT